MSRDIPIEARDSLKDAMNCLPQDYTSVQEYRLIRNLVHEAQQAVRSGKITDSLEQAVAVFDIMIQE